ncbi:MAG: FtsX-like permease family protein, partial [Bryobacteraceae bacterium]
AYFQTLSIPILDGRTFREGDQDVVVVSESLARRLWPGQSAIGKRYPRAKPLETVIGVAGNARTTALSDGQATEVYRPLSIAHAANAVFVVRSSVMPETVAGIVRTTVVAADPRTTPELALLQTAFTEKTQTSRRGAYVVSVLGAVALLLAAIGIFGVVAYSVTQRTREIGLRVALGAKPGDVLTAVLRQFLIPAAIGLGAGIAGAAGLSMILRGQLYGLSNLDPLSYAAGLVVFGVVAAIATLWPARRALRVQPSTALRYE